MHLFRHFDFVSKLLKIKYWGALIFGRKAPCWWFSTRRRRARPRATRFSASVEKIEPFHHWGVYACERERFFQLASLAGIGDAAAVPEPCACHPQRDQQEVPRMA